MFFLTVGVAFLLSFFATAINSYIALSTSLGPWIEATLVLGGMLIFYLFNGDKFFRLGRHRFEEEQVA